MSTPTENETPRSEDRSRCWAQTVEDGSEEQSGDGGAWAGITVTTEISISNHDDDVPNSTVDPKGAADDKATTEES